MALLVHLVLCSIQLCYSGWHLVSKVASKSGANPFVFASYRALCTLALMFLLVKIRKKKILIHRKDWGTIAVMGVCSFVNSVFTILALQYIRPVHYSIFQPCIPAVATIISICYGLEKFGLLKALGISCAIAGAMISKYEPSLDNSSEAYGAERSKEIAFGTLLVVIQVGCMGLLLVLQKFLISRYDSTVLAFSYYFVGTIVTLVVSLYAVGSKDSFSISFLFFDGGTGPWVALMYAAFSTFYTNNAYAWSGKQVSPSVTAIYNTFQPIFTALLSLLFLGDVMSLYEILGSCLVVLGMVTTLCSKHDTMNSESKTEAKFKED